MCKNSKLLYVVDLNYPTNSHLLLDTTLCACFTPCRGLSTFLPPIRPLLTLYPVMCPKTAPFSYHVAYPVLCRQGIYQNNVVYMRAHNVVCMRELAYATSRHIPRYIPCMRVYHPAYVPPCIPRFVPPCTVYSPVADSQLARAEKVPGPGEVFCKKAGNLNSN